MSATNLDLPILISADQIRRREFVTLRRGYDPDQVRAYLEQLADQAELMHAMLREARSEAEAAARTQAHPRVDPYEQLGERVASVIREADHVAETIRSEAAHEAEQLTHEARADADRIRTDAQSRAEEAHARADAAVRAARDEADQAITGLATRRDALVEQLGSMQERLIGVARDLGSAMDVKVTLPDIAAIDQLFMRPAERPSPDNGSSGTWNAVQPAAGLKVEPAESDSNEVAAPKEPIVVGEAENGAVDLTEDDPAYLDPTYEELWEGTDAMKLDLPEIPSLDLDWSDEDDDPLA